jgi:alkylhydroperoxidase/carboxymuconolactone decarboxylase family protein YurZ
MSEDTPVLDTLADITEVSVVRGSLDPREHMLARLAALVAVDAPAMSYLLNVGVAAEEGVTAEDVQGVLIAVAPIVGTPRIVSAAQNISDALGFVVTIAEAEAEAEAESADEDAPATV